jgi:hypothetical protein
MKINSYLLHGADEVLLSVSDGEKEIVAAIVDLDIEHEYDSDGRHTATLNVAVEGNFQE